MRPVASLVVLLAGLALPQGDLEAQVLAEPVLRGQVMVGDSLASAGTVILHRVSTEAQGEVDSVRVAGDGSFTFRLPSVPDPGQSEVYFASVRHAGILYFGKALTMAVQLDTLYQIQAYDTLMTPPEGVPVTVQARNLFLEHGESGGWSVTDLFQLRNDEALTLVAPEGGVVWQYPLAEGATDVTITEDDFGSIGAEAREGAIAVVSPLPPGDRLFVVRYAVPDPFLTIPIPTRTEVLEIMVEEPAPALDAADLEDSGVVEMAPGSTYRRLQGINLAGQSIELVEGEEDRLPPVRWLAVILALVLGGVGAWTVQKGGLAPPPARAAPATPTDRQSLVMEIARLDESFAARADVTPEERGAYEARRGALLRRLGEMG